MCKVGVIFDVDGVLLELTSAEEEVFFQAFKEVHGITGLSRDWDSYRIRNDEKIVEEILERYGLPRSELTRFRLHYLKLLENALALQRLKSIPIPGALDLVKRLKSLSRLGIATANFLSAAELRLAHSKLWNFVAAHAFGADGSGHKRETVARAVMSMDLAKERIVYVGDNLNDLDAASANGVAFIAFSTDAARRAKFHALGAVNISACHDQTLTFLKTLLHLDMASKL
jgi:HAD superfamily hydrolase (TIGR01549 family)